MSGSSSPLPSTFGLRPLPGTALVRGRLTGGVPRRRVDLTAEASPVVEALLAGTTVGEAAERTDVTVAQAGSIARRLLSIGAAGPVPPGGPDRGAPTLADVAAVIPAHDAAGTIRAAIEGLSGVDEIVVVDDGSTDATAAVARAAGARVVRNETPTGPAAARNAGVRACSREIVVLLDSDAAPASGWLPVLLAHLADPTVGGVAPRVLAIDDGTALGRYEVASGPLDLGEHAAVVRPDGPVTFVSTTALVLRRSLWELLGGFDEDLRFGEDLDFVWRAAREQQPLTYEPAAVVRHHHRSSMRAHLANRGGYGSASGPLSRRHPGHPRAAEAPPLLAAAVIAGLARLPRLAIGLGAASIGDTARRLAALGEPPAAAAREAVVATARSGRGLAAAVSRPWLPLALALVIARPPARAGVAATVALRLVLGRGRSTSGAPGADWAALRVLDDLAFSAGVLRGCIEACTVAPLTTRRPTGPMASTTVLGRELILP